MKRKGYALLEVLGILGVLVTMLAILAKPTKTLVADVHRMHRDFNSYADMSLMLRQLRKDIESAATVESPTDNLLLIKTPNSSLRYKFETDVIVKETIINDSQPDVVSRIWNVPHAAIKLKLREKNGQTEVVHVNSGIVRQRSGQLEKTFSNNNLYFVGLANKKAGAI